MFGRNKVQPYSPIAEEETLLPCAEEEVSEKKEEGCCFRTQKCKFIDTRMIPSKICFFLNDASQVIYISYLIVFLTSVGLNVKEAGVIAGCCLLTACIAAPLWGLLADYTSRSDLIFVILCVGASITLLPSPWIAAALTSSKTQISANLTVTVEDNSKPFSSDLFYIMLILQCVFCAFMNPIRGFTVSFVMSIVKSSDRGAEYGMQNLYGAVGVSISGVIAGYAVSRYTSSTLSVYTPIFYIFLPLSVLLLPAGIVAASQAKAVTNKKKVEINSKSRFKVLTNLCNTKNNIFMVSVIIAGVSNSAMGSFLFQLMQDQMNASKLTMGLANFVAGVGEIVVFIYAKPISKLLGGSTNCIMASIFSYFVRFLSLSFIKNEWLVLITQILHGISFAIFWVSAAEYTYILAPAEIYTTVFSIVVSVYINVGGIFGTFVSGMVYNDYGGNVLFLGIAGVCFSWVVFNLIFFHFPVITCRRRVIL